VPGAERTIFNHNVYIQSDANGVVLRNNILLRGSSHGMQLRPGGVAEGNLAARNAIGILLSGDLTGTFVGVDNVILEGDDVSAEDTKGYGFWIDATATSGTFANNIVAHEMSDDPRPIAVNNKASITGTNNVIYDWGDSGTSGPFRDPDRSLASYNAQMGGEGTFEDFVKELRAQSRQRWRTDYEATAINDYIREGFGPAN
jgi:hypothetical protein